MRYKIALQLIVMLLGFTLSQATVLTVFHGTKGQADKELLELTNKFEDIGFTIAAKNEHLEHHYYNKFKDKNLDLLNFYRIYDKDTIRELLLKNPDFGAFTPFNFLAFKKLAGDKGGDTTWYGELTADMMLDIIGERDASARETFSKMIKRLDDLVIKEMKPTSTEVLEFDSPLPKQPLLKMVKEFDSGEDVEEFVENFIMEYDSLFTTHDFVIAGFLDLKFEYADMELEFEKYDAYWVSSLCHFKFSNAIFNHGEPQAGVYAPCSIYFYIPKGSNKLHVGYAKVENWTTTTGIKNEAQLRYMKEVADEVLVVFKKLGFVEEGHSEELPKATQDQASKISKLNAIIERQKEEIKALKEALKKEQTDGSIEEIKALPKRVFTTPKMSLSDVAPKRLTAYYVANPQRVDELIANLKASGFEVLGTTQILEGKSVISVTNDQLKGSNSFLAALHILVDGTNEVRVQNPSYFAAAYLKDGYKYGDFKEVLGSLEAALGDMYATEDMLEFTKLKDYNFMPMMPHFDDTIELAAGENLSKKVAGGSASKYIAYTLELPNGATLVGHKMRARTNRFLEKIDQEKNAQILPYQSMIKDGKAYMLDPKYYLALSLPLLSMDDFMKIASTPDEIESSLKRAY